MITGDDLWAYGYDPKPSDSRNVQQEKRKIIIGSRPLLYTFWTNEYEGVHFSLLRSMHLKVIL